MPEHDEGRRQAREDEVGRHRLGPEEPARPHAEPARELQHDGEQDVVRQREDGAGYKRRERYPRLGAAPANEIEQRSREEGVERVIRDVERLDVPGVALLQPLRDVLRDDE